MEAKQKEISEAYKALGMNVPKHSDENDWSKIRVFQENHIQENFIEKRIEGDDIMGRPILLENII